MATKKTTVAAKVETKEEASKAAEVKVEAAKVEAPVKEEKVEAKKAPAKKAATKTEEKAEAKKTPAKKTATKTTAAKKEVAPVVTVQFGGQEVSMDTVIANAKSAYEAAGNKVSSIKDIQIYVKPEEYAAYYVINGDVTGRIDLF